MHEHHVGNLGEWRATHVKEKFGVLRFSSTGGDAHTRALEHFALLVSARTCQRCVAVRRARRGSSALRSRSGMRRSVSPAPPPSVRLASVSRRPVGTEPSASSPLPQADRSCLAPELRVLISWGGTCPIAASPLGCELSRSSRLEGLPALGHGRVSLLLVAA